MGSSFVQLAIKALATIVLLSLGAQIVGYALATILAAFVALVWQVIGLLRQIRTLRRHHRRVRKSAVPGCALR